MRIQERRLRQLIRETLLREMDPNANMDNTGGGGVGALPADDSKHVDSIGTKLNEMWSVWISTTGAYAIAINVYDPIPDIRKIPGAVEAIKQKLDPQKFAATMQKISAEPFLGFYPEITNELSKVDLKEDVSIKYELATTLDDIFKKYIGEIVRCAGFFLFRERYPDPPKNKKSDLSSIYKEAVEAVRGLCENPEVDAADDSPLIKTLFRAFNAVNSKFKLLMDDLSFAVK